MTIFFEKELRLEKKNKKATSSFEIEIAKPECHLSDILAKLKKFSINGLFCEK